jgi:hypothetical protein
MVKKEKLIKRQLKVFLNILHNYVKIIPKVVLHSFFHQFEVNCY